MAQICYGCFSQMSKAGPCPHCGYNSAEAAGKYPNALSEGTLLKKKYMLGRVMGQGGFGITYAALDMQSNTRVAIKEYLPSAFASRNVKGMVTAHSVQVEGNFEHGKESFLEEANALVELKESPYVVNIHDFFEENGTAYFVMEYVQGTNLKSYVKMMGGNLGEEAANNILLPIMEALEYVHSKGLVHRDIAPDNIIVTSDGSAKLIDFGAARYSTGEMSLSLDVILKHGYAPKEQYVRKGRQGPFTDVYAMGATYYYAVTGRTPPDSVERMSEDELIPPSTLGAKLSRNTETAILKALELQPADRFQSMADFASAIGGKAIVSAAPAAVVKAKAAEDVSFLAKAEEFINAGNWESALKCCDIILESDPENKQAKMYKRMAELELKEHKEEPKPAKENKEKPDVSKGTKNGSKKKLLIALLIVAVLIVSGGAAYFGINYNAAITAINEEHFSEAQEYLDKMPFADKLFSDEYKFINANNLEGNCQYAEALRLLRSIERIPVPQDIITRLAENTYNDAIVKYHLGLIEEARESFEIVKNDFPDAQKYLTLTTLKLNIDEIELYYNDLIDILGFEDSVEILLASETCLSKFICGRWEEEEGPYFLEIDDSSYVSSNFPKDDEVIYAYVHDGRLCLGNNKGMTKPVYEINICAAETIEILHYTLSFSEWLAASSYGTIEVPKEARFMTTLHKVW